MQNQNDTDCVPLSEQHCSRHAETVVARVQATQKKVDPMVLQTDMISLEASTDEVMPLAGDGDVE